MRSMRGRYVFMAGVALGTLVYLYISDKKSESRQKTNPKEDVAARWSNITCLETKTDPRYKICIHDVKKDIYVSKYLATKGAWEAGILKEMGELFKRDELLSLIDVGANIGVYSLYAAALGRDVVAIEPFEDNLVRLKKSIKLNGFTGRVTIIENAVSDRRGVGLIQNNPNNQGDTRIKMKGVSCIGDCKEQIPSNIRVESILLDDVVSKLRTKRAIMKIDIQGYEHLAFRKASVLLDNIFIPVIFMEWHIFTELKDTKGIDILKEEKLIEDMISLLLGKNYRPYKKLSVNKTLDTKRWRAWPSDVVWKYEI